MLAERNRSLNFVEANRQKRTTHGKTRSAEYLIWGAMIQRCTNPKNKSYADYGGRGIIVCERWLSFENFYADMGPRPSSGHSLDRRENDGNYEPDNCRWVTGEQQARNKRSNTIIAYKGKDMTLREASIASGVPYQVLIDRLGKLGWDTERALSTPVYIR